VASGTYLRYSLGPEFIAGAHLAGQGTASVGRAR
jgi:hypothetical protein